MLAPAKFALRLLIISCLLSFSVIAQPRFEVAAIKPPNPASREGYPTIANGRLTGENVPLRAFIEEAYGILPMQLTNVPGWVDAERWSIQAKGDEMATRTEVRAMLRALLAERFQLKIRADKKEQSFFVLKVKDEKKVSVQLTETEPASRLVYDIGTDGEKIVTQFRNLSMFGFARVLSREVQRVVIDETGLASGYDFKFEGLRDADRSLAFTLPLAPILGDIGLQLESRKGPIDVYVIDSVERPSEN